MFFFCGTFVKKTVLKTKGAKKMNEIQIFNHEEFGEIRTIEIDGQVYFVGVDVRSKHSFIFSYKDIGKAIFLNREDAVTKAHEAEKSRPKASTETYYEEY